MIIEKTADHVAMMIKHAERVVGNRNSASIIDGFGEFEMNGVEYQIQIVLEPKIKDWVHGDKITFRSVIE